MEQDYSKWWLPIDISTHGAGVDGLINWVHVFMFVLFVGWGAFFIHCLWKFRDKPGAKALYEPIAGGLSKAVELGVVVIEVLLLVALALPAWADFKDIAPKEGDPRAVHLRVVAKQFNWFFHYPGPDGVFGKTLIEKVSEQNAIGLDKKDPAAKDDIVSAADTMTMPEGRPIVASISSLDVIHSFKIPVMRLTQDAIPGQKMKIWFEAKTGSARAEPYEIACAQLCGFGHTGMDADLYIVSEEAFDAWVKSGGR